MTEKSKEPCWYVVHTYSGYENKVKDTLEKSVENNGMQNLIFDVRVPVEDVVEIKNGKRAKDAAQGLSRLCAGAYDRDQRELVCGA